MKRWVLEDYFIRGMKWFLAITIALWISLPFVVKTLILIMALDFVTGLLTAFIRKELCSGISFRGLAKKTLILILVAAAGIVNRSLHIGIDIGAAVAGAYVINELISILENCVRAGVPVPTVLVESLAKLKGTSSFLPNRHKGSHREPSSGHPAG